MKVTFFGHRDAPESVEDALTKAVIALIENEGADNFLVGHQGKFDSIAKRVLKRMKAVYPHINVTVALAYFPGSSGTPVPDDVDTVYPEGLESVPCRFAISKRNEWLVKEADVVITYVIGHIGGAARFKALAERRGKRIIDLTK